MSHRDLKCRTGYEISKRGATTITWLGSCCRRLLRALLPPLTPQSYDTYLQTTMIELSPTQRRSVLEIGAVLALALSASVAFAFDHSRNRVVCRAPWRRVACQESSPTQLFDTPTSHDYPARQNNLNLVQPSLVDDPNALALAPEYWLDLRGISISPKEALRFLDTLMETTAKETEEDYASASFVSRVLMDESEFSEKIRASADDIGGNSSLLLYGNNKDRPSISIYQHEQLRLAPFANVLKAVPNRNLDAVVAMDTVLGQGQWILVDSDPSSMRDSAEWMTKQVASLYELLITSYGRVDADDLGSLLLPKSMGNHETVSSGGIAVSVPTASTLIELDFTLMRAGLARQMKSIDDNESDLLLPAEGLSPHLQAALVIPFDVDIWRLLLDLKRAQ